MAQITLIHGDAAEHAVAADIMMTDPPFDMHGGMLAGIIAGYPVDHLVLVTTMRQLLGFIASGGWTLRFDFVLDGVAPKRSLSTRQPNYVHQTGVYLTRNGAASVFDRKLRPRSDTFDGNGYWPTILRAPRNVAGHCYGKSEQAWTDLLGSFRASSVVDPFAGGGVTAMAALELGIDCTLIEREEAKARSVAEKLRFLGAGFAAQFKGEA